MNSHPYSLRKRLSSTTLSVKTPTGSPLLSKSITRSTRKPSVQPSNLQLKHVIGTTTTTPSGLSCCEASSSFAYCAGSVAVLATIDDAGSLSYRYFKARPTATALTSTSSYYDATSTPTRRKSVFTPKRAQEDNFIGREWLDDTQTWSARERIKAATCVSLSSDGRLLAVGETGYNPRVLIFSTSSPETPLSIMIEHTVGVRSVSFSPDAKFLATLGDVNDGFLYIWTVNSRTGEAKLHSTNKCTTNVCDMTWCGNNVVTVGTRHIKIWSVSTSRRCSPRKTMLMKPDAMASPGPTPLQGRNCLLGKMVDATFTAIVAVGEDKAVVCADDGNICVLDLSGGNAELVSVEKFETAIAAIAFRTAAHRVVWAGGGGLQEQDLLCLSKLQDRDTPPRNGSLRKRRSRHSLLRQSLGIIQPRKASVVALGCLNNRAIAVDAEGSVKMLRFGESSEDYVSRLTSHRDLVRGVQSFPHGCKHGSFFTWARNGEVRFWGGDGDLLRVEMCEMGQFSDEEEPGTNELKVVRYFQSQRSFITGDRFGVIQIFHEDDWSTNCTLRAHSAEVNDIGVDGRSLVATGGRDRMVQLFRLRDGTLDLVQTLDDHISAVHKVLFTDDSRRLISCSGDRTVVVRDRVESQAAITDVLAFLSARVVTLKSSPLSMVLQQDQSTLVVSTQDRFVVKVDINNGGVLDSFKVSDKETEDSAVLSAICLGYDDDCPIIAGYSSTDKSIRVYNMVKGDLLGRDSGHTEGISDIAMIQVVEDGMPRKIIVSTGLDTTVMLWNVLPAPPALTPLQEFSQADLSFAHDSDSTPVKASPASLPPLRKILTKMDIAELSRSTSRNSSPCRTASPPRLQRKTSRLALSTSIEETDESTSPEQNRSRSKQRRVSDDQRSPSPQQVMRPKKQRSRTEFSKDAETKRNEWLRRSPSPTSASTPTTPKYQRANNGRLRRPPSVPSNLREHAAAQQRRQSVTTTGSDFGSIGMASEAACRMLKTYRKKLAASKVEVDLNDVEKELEAVLKIVRRKKGIDIAITAPHCGSGADVEGLTVLLEGTSIS